MNKKTRPSSCFAEQISPLRRFVAISLTVWLALGLYTFIDRRPFAPPTVVVMPAWVPFWPALTPLYLGMLLVTWLLPVAICNARYFRACVGAIICAFLLVMPWWILIPTTLHRPPLPEGWWAAPYRWLAHVDPPNNIVPCAHGIGPAIVAWFTGRDHPRWRWPLAGMLVLGLPSIALVWQHRPIDILLGTAAAVLAIATGEAVNYSLERVPRSGRT